MITLNKNDFILSYFALIIFIISYFIVILEEFFSLKKCKPVVLSSGIIWFIISIICLDKKNEIIIMKKAINDYFYIYINLFLFLLVSMVYINVLKERGFFHIINKWIILKKFNSRQLFVFTGLLAFFISPIADNLTTALLISSIIISLESENSNFVNICCINIVIASNAGGAFSPFGDITTLMVWQSGIINFTTFFKIFFPSFISFIIPCFIMYFLIEKKNFLIKNNLSVIKFGNKRIIFLFIITIIISIIFEHYLHLPACIGMTTGLSFLFFFSIYIKKKEKFSVVKEQNEPFTFDIMHSFKNIEWDTLFFFYGIIMSIGGLATLGYLENLSNILYNNFLYDLNKNLGITFANIIIGILSAFIDNIPVMFAILTMNPIMSESQWLLVTLTTGIGGSLLSIGSAAGIALMGQHKKYYTFMSHLKLSWIIIIGYIFGIIFHILINKF